MNKTQTPLNIKVIIGSTRQQRFSEKPANWIYEEAKKKEGVNAELLDLRDYPMPFFDEPASPSMAQGKHANEVVEKWAQKIKEADAYIIVTPEYNHGYSAVLKNAMDYLYHEWNRKPVGFVSYGSASGARSVEQLRMVAVELQMVPIRSAIHIPVEMLMKVWMEKVSIEKLLPQLKDRVDTFLTDLIWWANALKNARETVK